MSKNYYDILGVNEKANKDEIKKAYRTLSMKLHPDKNPGNTEAVGKFQEINEAYETLGDDQKKEEYDFQRNNPNPFMRMNSQGGHGGMEVPLDNLFNAFFGGGMPFGMPGGMQFNLNGMPQGQNIRVFHNGVPMNFQQGIQKPPPITINVNMKIEQILSKVSIPIEIERWIIENGNKLFEKETIYVNIPEGVDDNEIIIMSDKGNVVNENCKGDIKIITKIINETEYKRQGLDLLLEKNISLKDALCGFTYDIKHINGKSYTLNNNSGTIIIPEYKKIINGLGLVRGEHKGNLIIHFHIEFPEKLTEEQILKLKEVL